MPTRPQTRAAPKEEKVVGYVTFPYKGAAFALQKRAEQLDNTVYAVKQHIHTLRQASQIAIEGHKKAKDFLTLPSQLFEDPIPCLPGSSITKDTPPIKDIAPKDDLLSEDGVKSLLSQFACHDEKLAETVCKLNDPSIFLRAPVEELSERKCQINTLLSKDRLGKSHHHQEETVCTAASELNKTIASLSQACCIAYTPLSPYHDPHTICRDAKFRMKEYLTMECNYESRCLEEQAAERILEKEVFRIFQGIPVEQEKIMAPLVDKCNEILAEVETKVMEFHALTDWTAFESKHVDQFAREEETRPIVLTEENHPDDSQFFEYQVMQLDNLHIYHKLRKQESSHKPKTDESLGIKLKRAVTLSRHDYAHRGTWTISVGGHLIEYDRKEHAVLSMFNLRKCRLGVLSQKDPRSNKQSSTYCYFALYGQKVHEPSEKKKHRMKKEYKFRAPWGIAQAVHLELSKFCLPVEEKGSEKKGVKKVDSEKTEVVKEEKEMEEDTQPSLLGDAAGGSDTVHFSSSTDTVCS